MLVKDEESSGSNSDVSAEARLIDNSERWLGKYEPCWSMKRNAEEAAVMVQKHREQFATWALCPVSNDSSEFLIVVHRCYPFVFAWFFCVFPVFGWFVALWFCIILLGFGVFFSVALLWFCFVFAWFCCVLPVLGWFVALCSQCFSLCVFVILHDLYHPDPATTEPERKVATSALCPLANDSSELLIVVYRCYLSMCQLTASESIENRWRVGSTSLANSRQIAIKSLSNR